MATSSQDGDDHNGQTEGLRSTSGAQLGVDALHNEDAEDARALDEGAIRINPEIMRGVAPLVDLEQVRVVVLQPASSWARWTEGVMIHLVSSGLAFALGLIAARYNVWG